MALNKLKFNSLNVTPTAGKAVGFNSSANGLEATLSGGAMTFIKKLTASSSSTLSFVDGSSDVVLDSTYKEYMFILNNIHPATDAVNTTFQASTDGGSNYNTTITSTFFRAAHDEADSVVSSVVYGTPQDQAQGSAFQTLNYQTGNDNDQSATGILHLFNPSSTTFVKHFIYTGQDAGYSNISNERFVAGYFNTTSALDAIQFKMESGNIDAGTITLYGIN